MRKEDIARKIDALLSKTVERGATEAEAIAAAQKAQELMAKYDIDITAFEQAQEAIGIDNFAAARRWAQGLATVVGTNMRCEVLLYHQDRQAFMRFIGRDSDRVTALKTYQMLLEVCKKGVQKIKAELKLRGRRITGIEESYAHGFLTSVKEEMERTTTALMLVTPDDVKEYFNEKFPNVVKRTLAMNNSQAEAHQAGYEDGKAAIGRRQLR